MLPLRLLTYPLVSHFATVSARPQLSSVWLGLVLHEAGLSRGHKGSFEHARDLARAGLPMSESGYHAHG
jgi:hypothetical protein